MIFATPTILAALLFGGQALAACFTPEPDQRICYNSAGATTQNVTLKEVQYTAKYLRYYGGLASSPPFFSMPAVDGDACPEWQVTSKGSTLVLAKFVGEKNGSVTFNDIANTIDGGAAETTDQIASALMGCGTAGGQVCLTPINFPSMSWTIFQNIMFLEVRLMAKFVWYRG